MRAVDAAAAQLDQLQQQVAQWQQTAAQWQRHADEISNRITMLMNASANLDAEIAGKRQQSTDWDEALLAEEFGLYRPRFAFANSTQYKEALAQVRNEQKAHMRMLSDAASNTNWTVNGSKAQGRKMVRDVQKLLLRGFNSECDELISKVKTSNIDKTVDRMRRLAETISKLGATLGISISPYYVGLKEREAYLAYEFAMVKEREKVEISEARAREREELKVQKEIEEKRRQLRKEETQYEKALAEAVAKLEGASPEEESAVREKIAELEASIEEVRKGIADVDYREANKRAGFVYVISNIGSFGEGIYKIGMTRRLEPMERVAELGDASVPFNFDVHAMIFSNDAPGLEAALHREFEGSKINLINHRREFFRCSLEDINSSVVRNYDRTVEFTDVPDAEQFRMSELMRKANATS